MIVIILAEATRVYCKGRLRGRNVAINEQRERHDSRGHHGMPKVAGAILKKSLAQVLRQKLRVKKPAFEGCHLKHSTQGCHSKHSTIKASTAHKGVI